MCKPCVLHRTLDEKKVRDARRNPPPRAPCAMRGDGGRHLPAPASACGMDCGICKCGCRVNVGGPGCSCPRKIASTIGMGLGIWVLPQRNHSLSAFANHGAEHTHVGKKSHLLGALDAAEPKLRARARRKRGSLWLHHLRKHAMPLFPQGECPVCCPQYGNPTRARLGSLVPVRLATHKRRLPTSSLPRCLRTAQRT
jgi:hypothetical protein